MKKIIFLSILISVFTSMAEAKSLCIAHRGHIEKHLENSLEALKSAMDIGAGGIEFDVVHTAEGFPIIMHDQSLGRTTQTKSGHALLYPENKDKIKCPDKSIKKLTYKEIANQCELKNGSPIPTLEDLLKLITSHNYQGNIFIEFKDIPSLTTMELIESYLGPSMDRVRLLSFKSKALDVAYQYSDKFPLLSKSKAFQLYVFFKKPKNDYGLNVRFGRGRLKKMAKHEDRETSVWTVNGGGKILEAASKKVDFITTNSLELCLSLLP